METETIAISLETRVTPITFILPTRTLLSSCYEQQNYKSGKLVMIHFICKGYTGFFHTGN